MTSISPRRASIPVRDYFLGAVLPAGEHRLYLLYDPMPWKIGLVLALGDLAALAVLFLRKLKCYDGSLK